MDSGMCERAPFEAGLLVVTSARIAYGLSYIPLPGEPHYSARLNGAHVMT